MSNSILILEKPRRVLTEHQILVSHHVELLLPITDYIVRILDGKIDAQGSPAELREAGELDGLIAVEEAEVSAEEPITNDKKQDKELAVVEDGESQEQGKKSKKAKGPGKKLVQGATQYNMVELDKADLSLIDEERPVGNVKWQTYKLYIRAATYITWTLTLMVLRTLFSDWKQEREADCCFSYFPNLYCRREMVAESVG